MKGDRRCSWCGNREGVLGTRDIDERGRCAECRELIAGGRAIISESELDARLRVHRRKHKVAISHGKPRDPRPAPAPPPTQGDFDDL